ncbi:hypothetical protein [Pararhodobacter sp.]|uniref:hypothetical protein n=1 Tax=Pararhodobacter sp. TaxID=2127056 RepID=UPI002FDE97A8
MAHKVHFYDADKGFDEDGLLRPTRTVETDDPAEMLSLAAAAIQESGSIMSASISADWRLSETLEEHLRVTNMLARWHEENPIKDAWIGALHEDIDAWNASGVDTPEDLEKYLMLQSFSDHYKEIHGFRPGSGQVSMDMSIEEIEAALEGEIGDPRPEWPGP